MIHFPFVFVQGKNYREFPFSWYTTNLNYFYYLRTFLRGRGLGWGGVKTCIFATIDDHFDRSFANFSRCLMSSSFFSCLGSSSNAFWDVCCCFFASSKSSFITVARVVIGLPLKAVVAWSKKWIVAYFAGVSSAIRRTWPSIRQRAARMIGVNSLVSNFLWFWWKENYSMLIDELVWKGPDFCFLDAAYVYLIRSWTRSSRFVAFDSPWTLKVAIFNRFLRLDLVAFW